MVTLKIEKRYKQTSMGIIPEDWTVKKFEDVIDDFSAGQTPSRTKPEYFKGNIPWITSGELNYNIITDTKEKITTEAAKNANLKIVSKGTFLFAISGLEAEGTSGSCAITGINSTTNQSTMSLCPKKGVLLTKYLYHYYVAYGKRLALKYCQGTKQQDYSAAIVKTLPIILPPTIEEQAAIAQVLSDTDELIDSLGRLIEKKKLIEQAAMQELLTGKKRLPKFSGESRVNKFKLTDIGSVPEDWNVIEFGDIVTYTKGFAFKPDDYGSFGIRILRVSDTDSNGIIDRDDIFIDPIKAKSYSKWMLHEDDLVFSTVGSKPPMYNSMVGRAIIVDKKHHGILLNQNAVLVRSKRKTKFKQHLLLNHFRTKKYLHYIETIFRGNANQASITLDDLFKFQLALPIDESEQSAIAQVFMNMDSEIEALEQERDKYKQLKVGLMQQLLTGRIRLKWKS